MFDTSYAPIFVVCVVALIAHRLSKLGRRPAGYPPGPPTLPIIGNLHLMPKKKAHLQFQKWAEEYGPVYSLILGTKVMIVLSSDQAIKDLLDKRSGIYSSRPEMYLGQIVSGGLRMLLMVSFHQMPLKAITLRKALTRPGIRRHMAHDSQDRPQQFKHKGCKNVRSVSRFRK